MPIVHGGHFRHRLATFVIWGARDVTCNAQLRGGQIERADYGSLVSQRSGVHNTAHPPPYHDIAPGRTMEMAGRPDWAALANVLLNYFPLVLSLLPQEFDAVRSFFE